MSDDESVVDIHTMAGKFKSVAELKNQVTLQFKALSAAYDRIKTLEEENVHLKELLNGVVPQLPKVQEEPSLFIVPKEISICEMEISKLQEVSMQRVLTLEETKRLDLLVKNLYIAKEKNNIIDGKSRKSKDISDVDLLTIIDTNNE